MLIGISGLISSGKDTIADYLVQQHNFRRESWAASLKDAVSAVFGWDRELLEGRTEVARNWREVRDEWWSLRLGMNITPRWILQYWGTEVCRVGFHEDIWIASIENKLRSTSQSVVISDCRFVNELETIRRLGGLTVRVVRGPDPEWIHVARSDFEQFKRMYPQIHASEYSSVTFKHDHVIYNDGTIEDLQHSISSLLLSLQSSKQSVCV